MEGSASLRRRVGARVLLAIGTVVVVAGGLLSLSATSPARAATTAHYPADDAAGVPSSTAVIAHLDVSSFGRRGEFRLVLTGPGGDRVPGRSRTDGSTVSFTPAEPLRLGTHTAEVHRVVAELGEDSVVDTWRFTAKGPQRMNDGHGGSILLIARPGTTDRYLAEVLRAEGLGGFDVVTPDDVTDDLLAHHAVVVVGAHSATGDHVDALVSWVGSGGELVALRPTGALATLAGLVPTGGRVSDDYYRIDASRAPLTGLTATPMQFKGSAGVYRTRPDVRTLATLTREAGRAAAPAVTMRPVGEGAHVAAFAFDVADSVIRLRQGNPDWAGQERDGRPPIRPNDLFTGGSGSADYLDLDNIGIPQADETMRALTAVITTLHDETAPLPRLWYLPNGETAALVMAADDHDSADGTRRSVERMLALDEPGCDPDRWQCARATSWLYPTAPLPSAVATELSRKGFDFGVHASTDCADWTPASLDRAFERSLIEFREAYPALPDQRGHRMHCIAFSDWMTMPVTGRRWGVRMDLNYYNWPAEWVDGRPGYLTGSALPMRFADVDGTMVNVFQQETHLVNETWDDEQEAAAIEALIAAAGDERGYVGAFGTHYDFSDEFDVRLMEVARRHDTPMVSVRQLLDFVDGREASRLTNVEFSAGVLGFRMAVDRRAEGLLTGMIPVRSGTRELVSLTDGSDAVAFEVRTVKGADYAFFPARSVGYTAIYEVIDA